MKKLILLLIVLGTTQIGFAQTFKIDAEHTSVTSKVQRFGKVNVVGRFNKVDGEIIYNSDPTKISADVTISVDSYTANNTAGENAVKGPAFLDAANYPNIQFKSESVSSRRGKHVMKGQLTIHGTTKEVEFPFELMNPSKNPRGLNTIAVSATLTINRQDFGVSFDRKLPGGTSLIGNEVTIELNVLAIAD